MDTEYQEKLDDIRIYMTENPHSNAFEMSKELGIPYSIIWNYIKEVNKRDKEVNNE